MVSLVDPCSLSLPQFEVNTSDTISECGDNYDKLLKLQKNATCNSIVKKSHAPPRN